MDKAESDVGHHDVRALAWALWGWMGAANELARQVPEFNGAFSGFGGWLTQLQFADDGRSRSEVIHEGTRLDANSTKPFSDEPDLDEGEAHARVRRMRVALVAIGREIVSRGREALDQA